jgi:hypothetical protein
VSSTNGYPPEPFDAVVLAGGASRRMGQDKTTLYVGGLTLLDRVLASVAGAGRVVVVGPQRPVAREVVVGPQRPVAREVVWALEEPPGAGPVAALAAGLPHVTAPRRRGPPVRHRGHRRRPPRPAGDPPTGFPGPGRCRGIPGQP